MSEVLDFESVNKVVNETVNEVKKMKGRPKGIKTMWRKHEAVHYLREEDETGKQVRTEKVNPDCRFCKKKLKREQNKLASATIQAVEVL